MGKVCVDMSMSLDGFVAGPQIDAANPMGVGGTRLHQWLFADPQDPRDSAVSAELLDSVGAVVLGRTTFDIGVGIWDDVPFPVPSFVVTHRRRDELVMRSGTFTFVTEGVAEAVRRAVAASGERKVEVMGGATVQQVIAAGLLDELQINLIPVLLGGGVRMFPELGGGPVELKRTRVVESSAVTHLRFRVTRPV